MLFAICRPPRVPSGNFRTSAADCPPRGTRHESPAKALLTYRRTTARSRSSRNFDTKVSLASRAVGGCKLCPYENSFQRYLFFVPDWTGHSLLCRSLDNDAGWELCAARLLGLCGHLVEALCCAAWSQGGFGSLRDAGWSGPLFRHCDWRSGLLFPQ